MTTLTERSSKRFSPTRLWDALIKGYIIKLDDPEKAFAVLQNCVRNHGILPSSFTFCSLIHCFSSRGNMARAIEVVELMTDDTVKYPFDNFVCSAVISGFCKMGKPELALGFFENALNSGTLKPNVVTYTSLVSALCMLDRVNEVSGLFCKMLKEGLAFDVIFYSCWICVYLREGALMEAFREYGEMVKWGINPDTVSYTILIDGFSKEGNAEKAVGLLEKMIKNGVKPNLVTYTSLIQGFCKKGKLEEAFSIFKNIQALGLEVDEFMYATLIDGICRRGDLDHAFYLLGDMEKKGIKPSIITYNTVINGLCKVGRTSEADGVSKGVLGDIVTYGTLLHGYIGEENVKGVLETKKRFQVAGVCLDVVMCNILLKALFMVGAYEDAHSLYEAMPELDLLADSVTYFTMIYGYCSVGRIEEALEVFDEFRKTSVSSVASYNCILKALCKNRMLDMAVEVFIELCDKGLALDIGVYKTLINAIFAELGAEGVLNLVCSFQNLRSDVYDVICNGAIRFLCKRASLDAANAVFVMMRRTGSVVMCDSYYSMLKGVLTAGKKTLFRPFMTMFVKEYGLLLPMVGKMLLFYLCLKDVDKALQYLKMVAGNTSALSIPATVFKMLVETGRASDAYELLLRAENNMPVMGVVDYTIMVDGLCKSGYIHKALDLCAFARHEGITLNIITYNSVINGLCRQGCLVEAFRLFDSLERIDLVPSRITIAILIDTLCKEGLLLDAKKLFDRMVSKGFEPSLHVYNSFIDAYCKFGQMEEALKLLSNLELKGVMPDEFTTSAMINGYCQKGDMEGALSFFVQFNRKSRSPDFLGFLYLVRGLCTKGRMEEARSILREMLQSSSVDELISRVDTEVESDSIKSILDDLCERGNVHEAVTVLDEIGSMFFPSQRKLQANHGPQTPNELYEHETLDTDSPRSVVSSQITDADSNNCTLRNGDVVWENPLNVGKDFRIHNFDFFYSTISSLCSKGELQQANIIVRNMLSSVNGDI